MAIALDAVSSGQADAASSLTISHTVAGSNRLLIVNAHAEDTNSADTVVSGITYNGVALTKIRHSTVNDGTDFDRVEQWRLVAPDTGTHDIVITWAGTVDGVIGGGISLTGVDQTNPINTSGGESDVTDTNAQAALTTTVDDCWLISAINGMVSGADLTPASGQTHNYEITNAGNMRGESGREAVGVANAYTDTWTRTEASGSFLCLSVAAIAPSVDASYSGRGVGRGIGRGILR